ncbi:MAG: alpha/beta hydrolase [Bacteroidota bacterium]
MMYCLPGLGTDHRIFERLRLGEKVAFLDWIPPREDESLAEYAWRMTQRIDHPSPVLLGLSFGGVVAQEMAQQINCEGLILISSIQDPDELPLHMKLWRYLPLYRLARGSWRINTLPVWANWFGISKAEEQQLLMEMFRAAEDQIRIWSMEQLIFWRPAFQEQDLPPYVRIHGKRDKVFPLNDRSRSYHIQWIEEGNHFMVYQKAEEISRIVQEFLHQLSR